MPPADSGLRGHLLIRVEEASGKTQKDQFTWDTSSSTNFEAFIKGSSSRARYGCWGRALLLCALLTRLPCRPLAVEIRGGAYNVKVAISLVSEAYVRFADLFTCARFFARRRNPPKRR